MNMNDSKPAFETEVT